MDFENIFYDLVDLQLGEILENEPLYKHTTFKVGGPARLFVYIQDVEALKRGIQYCRQHQIKHMVIGRGSDLLFSDKEYEGVISGVTKWGVYVELENTVEGLVHVADMRDDHYEFTEQTYELTGEHSGKSYTLGQTVRVRVTDADKLQRTVNFEIIS